MDVPILNASGCLDAQVAPGGCSKPGRVRDEDGDAAAARGEPASRGSPRRSTGCSTPSACRTSGIEACADSALPPGGARRPAVGVRGRVPRRTTRPSASSWTTWTMSVVELNLSCPNVEEAQETAAELVAAAQSATAKPLYAKLSPATPDSQRPRARSRTPARTAVAREHDPGLALDPVTRRPVLGRGAGGYSGPGARSRSPACTRAQRRSTSPSSAWAASARDGTPSTFSRARAPWPSDGALRRPVRTGPGPRRACPEAHALGAPGAVGRPAARGRSALSGGVSSELTTQKSLQSAKTLLLDQRGVLVDSSGSWSRRRRTPRRPPVHSISGWKRFRGRTTSVSGGPSSSGT